MKFHRFLTLLLLSFLPSVAVADECPTVIADKKNKLYYSGKDFSCFDSSQTLKRKGYARARAATRSNYTGWWRMNLNPVEDTCSGISVRGSGRVTFFLQLKQDKEDLFGAVCPSPERYTGQSLGSRGFVVVAKREIQRDDTCGGTASEMAYSFSAAQLDDKLSTAREVTYRAVKTCLDPAFGHVRCHTVWKGDGGREMPNHRFWPTVPENLTQFDATCSDALTRCDGCHG